VTEKRGKDRTERNLASSRDRVARDIHHHGSSSVPLVRTSRVRQWWGSPHRLVARPFIRCLGRLFPRQWHVPPCSPSPAHVFLLSPVSGRSGRGSASRHVFHNDVPILELPSRLVSGGY